MIRKFSFVFLIPFFAFISCATSKYASEPSDALFAKDLHPIGRARLLNDQSFELISSAVHFGFSFKGRQCRLFVSIPSWLDHNYLQYDLDGVYQKRIRISNDSTVPILIDAPDNGNHQVWIYKATEAHTGPVFIKRLEGNKLRSLLDPNGPTIEFIGNSITCGAAADASEVPCGTGLYHDQHNAYYAYGPRVARRLGVNFVLSSVSGIGIYRNWNSDGPTMRDVYEKLDFQENSKRVWDFAHFKPQIVSIALGTNDLSNGDGERQRLPFDSARFVNKYIEFVSEVKSFYSGAQIVLLSSPMLNGNKKLVLENCLKAVKKSIDSAYIPNKPVALYFFKPMHARGCTGHPSVEDHAVLADELVPFFKKLME